MRKNPNSSSYMLSKNEKLFLKYVYTYYKHFIYIILISSSFLFSQNIKDLQRLQKEYENLTKNRTQIPLDVPSLENTTVSDPRNILNPAFQFESSITDSIQKEIIDRYFGYDFFTNKDSIAFWESLPLSSDYILGPGDEVVISLWGETQLRKTYVISKDGKIFDDKVGVLFISGKSIVDVKNYLKDQFSTKYSTLSGAKPSSFIDITLGELRSINVSFVGEVHNPGQYPIHSLSNLITSLMQIGGIDTSGTLREIKIIRDNETFANIDLYKFLLRGEINDDIQLLDQDIVLVSMRNSTVEIDSSIARPGIYEMLPNETLGDLIKFAGGFTPFSSKNIIVNRLNYSRDEKAYLGPENYYLDYTSSKNFTIENGDRVIVRKIETFTKKVEIVGQVKKTWSLWIF